MDELSAVFDDLNSRDKRGVKRKSCPTPVFNSLRRRGRPPKQSLSSLDEGIGSSLDPLNDSIAHSVKTRKRVTNSKQFDSKYFYDSVVDRIENKYKNKGKEDAIIDVHNLKIIDKKGFVEQRVRTEIGYFAENTFEDLRLNSFRNKELISCPLIASTPNVTPTQSTTRQQIIKDKPKQNSRAVQLRGSANQSNIQTFKQSMTDIMVASDDGSDEDSAQDLNVVNHFEDSDEDSVETNDSEEFGENHPLLKYENRNYWKDISYQIICLKKTIEMLINDKKDRFKDALKVRAFKTANTNNIRDLPSGPHMIPIVCFNREGELDFEFHLLSANSPIEAKDRLQIDSEIIYLSQIIYECITLHSKSKTSQKSLFYSKRQLEYK